MKKRFLMILVLSLLWCNVGFAENINIKLDCSFVVEGDYFIVVKGNKIFVNGYAQSLKLTDDFLYINPMSSSYTISINRYTLKAVLRMLQDHQGTCKKVSKKQF